MSEKHVALVGKEGARCPTDKGQPHKEANKNHHNARKIVREKERERERDRERERERERARAPLYVCAMCCVLHQASCQERRQWKEGVFWNKISPTY